MEAWVSALEAAEIGLILKAQLNGIEDRVEPVRDLELEDAGATVVLIGNGAAEVPIIGVSKACDTEFDAVVGTEVADRPLDFGLEPIGVSRVQIDVLREAPGRTEYALAKRGASLE